MKRSLNPKEEKELIYWAIFSTIIFLPSAILLLEFLPKPRVDDRILIGRAIVFISAIYFVTFVILVGSRYLANWLVRRKD